MRSHVKLVGLLALWLVVSPPSDAFAQWAPGGIPVPGAAAGGGPRVVADGTGGIWIGWSDDRQYSTNGGDGYAQRLTAAGALSSGLPPVGAVVCATPIEQWVGTIAADGRGGAYFGWTEFRLPGNWYTPCVQHLDALGSVAADWPAEGLSLAPTGDAHDVPQIVPDGAGGAFFAWDDMRNGTDFDLYLQHLTASGTPAPGWPAGGTPLAAYPGDQYIWTPMLSDGAGGVVLNWSDGRPGAPGLYMAHVQSDGTPAPGWAAGGTRVANRGLIGTVPDGSGGYYLGLVKSSFVYSSDTTYYLLRVTSTGAIASGWPANGTVVCAADFVRNSPHISSDAAGHVFLTWEDYRGHGYSHVYATQYLPDGTLAPGWIPNGTLVTTLPRYQFADDIVADGYGGAYIVGEYDGGSSDLGFIQHIGSNGLPAPGWSTDGMVLNPQARGPEAKLASDGQGGAFAVWNNNFAGVYANHFANEYATATLLSLASSDARPDLVSLLWQGDAALAVNASVERRTATSEWLALGAPSLDGTDRLRYEDHDVTPGERYAYRLAYQMDGASRTTSEAWVTVPAAAQFALAGLRPNPASAADLHVAFSLPDAAPARLELIDVTGRRVASLDVGALGAGSHVERLQPDARMPAGLYWLRLTQGNRSLVTRAVVTG